MNFRRVLMSLERLYSTVLDVEQLRRTQPALLSAGGDADFQNKNLEQWSVFGLRYFIQPRCLGEITFELFQQGSSIRRSEGKDLETAKGIGSTWYKVHNYNRQAFIS